MSLLNGPPHIHLLKLHLAFTGTAEEAYTDGLALACVGPAHAVCTVTVNKFLTCSTMVVFHTS